MDFLLLNYSVLMILVGTIGCGGKNNPRMDEGVNGGDDPLGNVEEVWCCRIIGTRLRDSLDLFKWCVLIKLTFKWCDDKKKSFSSRIS